MAADPPEEPPRRGRWRSKHTKGRASVGLGFLEARRERRRKKRELAEADAFLTAKDVKSS